jgi:hypothetical protein
MNVMKVVPRGYDKRARKLFSPAECAAAERNRAGAGRVARDLQVLSQSRRIVYFCWADRGDGMAPVGFHRDNFDGRVRPKRPMRRLVPAARDEQRPRHLRPRLDRS